MRGQCLVAAVGEGRGGRGKERRPVVRWKAERKGFRPSTSPREERATHPGFLWGLRLPRGSAKYEDVLSGR